MGRRQRNREWDVAMGIGQLVAFGVALIWLFPFGRTIFSGPLLVLILGVLLFLFVMVAVLLLRKMAKPTSHSTTLNFTASSPFQPSSFQPSTASEPNDLTEQVRAVDWFQFEKLVEVLYRESGYNVYRTGGANPDGGIDLIVEKNGIKEAIQCKHWKSWSVGVRNVREFLGALTDSGLSKGVFITIRGYTKEAKALAAKHDIQIVGEVELQKMLERIGGQGNHQISKLLQDKRKYCPKCGNEMVKRTANKGPNIGKQFWGCSSFPRCRYMMDLR